MGIDLPLIWAIIIIFGVMMYVVMDGFDLGIGILFPFIKGEKDRDVMMNTVAPVWDGNETWLVLGGAALFGAFPLAYSVVPMLMGALGLVIAVNFATQPAIVILGLTIATMGALTRFSPIAKRPAKVLAKVQPEP